MASPAQKTDNICSQVGLIGFRTSLVPVTTDLSSRCFYAKKLITYSVSWRFIAVSRTVAATDFDGRCRWKYLKENVLRTVWVLADDSTDDFLVTDRRVHT